jgi:hypothetical protein
VQVDQRNASRYMEKLKMKQLSKAGVDYNESRGGEIRRR